jgi:uncharacterized protein YciI
MADEKILVLTLPSSNRILILEFIIRVGLSNNFGSLYVILVIIFFEHCDKQLIMNKINSLQNKLSKNLKPVLTITMLILYYTNSLGQAINQNYDSTLAKRMGADDYGMKMYVLVIMKTGSNTYETKSTSDSLFAGHLSNINKLAEQNKLVVAGPFGKNDNDFRGIFILNVTTLNEARKLLETDPAIKARLLKPDLYSWYGSAALSQYLKDADKIWKIKP